MDELVKYNILDKNYTRSVVWTIKRITIAPKHIFSGLQGLAAEKLAQSGAPKSFMSWLF